MRNISRRKVSSLEDVNRELDNLRFALEKLPVIIGSGIPEGVEVAKEGSFYLNIDGGASTTLYIKESGGLSDIGWVAK